MAINAIAPASPASVVCSASAAKLPSRKNTVGRRVNEASSSEPRGSALVLTIHVSADVCALGATEGPGVGPGGLIGADA